MGDKATTYSFIHTHMRMCAFERVCEPAGMRARCVVSICCIIISTNWICSVLRLRKTFVPVYWKHTPSNPSFFFVFWGFFLFFIIITFLLYLTFQDIFEAQQRGRGRPSCMKSCKKLGVDVEKCNKICKNRGPPQETPQESPPGPPPGQPNSRIGV